MTTSHKQKSAPAPTPASNSGVGLTQWWPPRNPVFGSGLPPYPAPRRPQLGGGGVPPQKGVNGPKTARNDSHGTLPRLHHSVGGQSLPPLEHASAEFIPPYEPGCCESRTLSRLFTLSVNMLSDLATYGFQPSMSRSHIVRTILLFWFALVLWDGESEGRGTKGHCSKG